MVDNGSSDLRPFLACGYTHANLLSTELTALACIVPATRPDPSWGVKIRFHRVAPLGEDVA
jgi:hypothetical protein